MEEQRPRTLLAAIALSPCNKAVTEVENPSQQSMKDTIVVWQSQVHQREYQIWRLSGGTDTDEVERCTDSELSVRIPVSRQRVWRSL